MDLVPLDSVSNPGLPNKYDNAIGPVAKKILYAGSKGPGMVDSFYKDREDIRQKQNFARQ